jgi:cysteine desulfurase
MVLKNKKIYLDNASTTCVDRRVILAMEPFWSEIYANPSNIYSFGLEAKEALEKSRLKIANFLGSDPNEIIFTSGGTESNNLAIFGSVAKFKTGRIITTAIEHPSVLKPVQKLEKQGFEIIKISPKKNGVINAEDINRYLNQKTILVSVMYANNEIGTVQPIAEIAKIISNFRNSTKRVGNQVSYPLFHTDACQATQYLEMDVKKLGVDMLTINGSKIHGPKGIGALFIRKSVELEPQILGGGQEKGLRSGTENVAGIVGLGQAISLIDKKDVPKTKKIRDFIIDQLIRIEGAELNGCKRRRLPNNVNISFSGVEGESLVLYLDRAGICVATGSACSAQSLEPSHVITAIKNREVAHSSLRITLSRYNTMSEAKIAVEQIKKSVKKLRGIS